jgi:nicotinamidase-related amidase
MTDRLGGDSAALILVDVQRGFDDEGYWGPRNNPAAETNMARLLAAWRERGEPVVFVRHDSDTPGSPLVPGTPGNAFKPEITGEPDLLLTKSVHSAFLGRPALGPWLDERGIRTVVVAGIQTNRCCETTARMGGDLGYRVLFVLDATYTFGETALDGSAVTADEFARLTAANLRDNFADVVSTDELCHTPSPVT